MGEDGKMTLENNAEIARKLGVTKSAVLYRKKSDVFFKNRFFLEAWNELSKRYINSKNTLRDISIKLSEKRIQTDFALILYDKGFFESLESARSFLSSKVFYNATERTPSSKHVLKLEEMIKEYEIFKGQK